MHVWINHLSKKTKQKKTFFSCFYFTHHYYILTIVEIKYNYVIRWQRCFLFIQCIKLQMRLCQNDTHTKKDGAGHVYCEYSLIQWIFTVLGMLLSPRLPWQLRNVYWYEIHLDSSFKYTIKVIWFNTSQPSGHFVVIHV